RVGPARARRLSPRQPPRAAAGGQDLLAHRRGSRARGAGAASRRPRLARRGAFQSGVRRLRPPARRNGARRQDPRSPPPRVGLARPLQLASPTLPVGAYSYPQGLEAAIEAGHVRDAGTAERWIGDMLEFSMARLELPLLQRLIHEASQ